MTTRLPHDHVVIGRAMLNALAGMGGGSIFLLLLGELVRKQQYEERRQGWGR